MAYVDCPKNIVCVRVVYRKQRAHHHHILALGISRCSARGARRMSLVAANILVPLVVDTGAQEPLTTLCLRNAGGGWRADAAAVVAGAMFLLSCAMSRMNIKTRQNDSYPMCSRADVIYEDAVRTRHNRRIFVRLFVFFCLKRSKRHNNAPRCNRNPIYEMPIWT